MVCSIIQLFFEKLEVKLKAKDLKDLSNEELDKILKMEEVLKAHHSAKIEKINIHKARITVFNDIIKSLGASGILGYLGKNYTQLDQIIETLKGIKLW